MKGRRRENGERVMLVTALLLMGVVLEIFHQTGDWKRELPVFRPVGMQTEESSTEGKEEEEASRKEKGAAVRKYQARETEKEKETGAGRETEEPFGSLLQIEETEGGEEWKTAQRDVPGKVETERLTMEKVGGIKENEKPDRPAVFLDLGNSLTPCPVRIFCGEEIKEQYCVGASDLKPELWPVYAAYSDGSIRRLSPLMYSAEGFSSAVPGRFQGVIRWQDLSVEVPYEVVDFQAILHLNGGACVGNSGNVRCLSDYILEKIDPPQRTGYTFEGWYLDEELTRNAVFPLHAEEAEIHLYAAWKLREMSYEVENGVLMVPDGCFLLVEREFARMAAGVEEIYVGAQVETVEPGAFLGVDTLRYIDVDWKNSRYTTLNCSLYTKDGKCLVASPNGLTGIYRVYEGTETVGKYAFYESRLSHIILPEGIKNIGERAFGEHLSKLRFGGTMPPEKIDGKAFEKAGKQLIIEVPKASLERYREALKACVPCPEEQIVGIEAEE